MNLDTGQIYFVSDNYRIIAIVGTLKPANVHVGQELFGKIVHAIYNIFRNVRGDFLWGCVYIHVYVCSVFILCTNINIIPLTVTTSSTFELDNEVVGVDV